MRTKLLVWIGMALSNAFYEHAAERTFFQGIVLINLAAVEWAMRRRV